MKPVIKKPKKKLHIPKIWFIFIPIILFLLIFFRLYNLDQTARFTRDESSDLVRMHQYYQSKKITLVGPISSTNSKVFGSLTYYMLMPFAAIGNFEPVSPAYGAAFWGVLTAILIIIITRKINKSLVPYAIILSMLWYPLLETSRWAWNPHFVLFWIALGIWFYLRKTTVSYFFAGFCLALAFHNHYIAIIATGVFVLLVSLLLFLKKNIKQPLSLIIGYLLPFSAFVIFDLRHPPGLFFNHYLAQGNISNTQATTFPAAISTIFSNVNLFLNYVTQNQFLAILLGITIIAIFVFDIRKNKKALLFLVPVIAQIVAGAFLDTLQTRYLLPGLIFFFVWLIIPRTNFGSIASKVAFLILIVGSLFSVYPQLHHIEVQPDVATIAKVDKIIVNLVHTKHIKNANIAAVASPDADTFGLNIRDTLQIRDINFLATSQYDVSEQLLVLSTSDEKIVRNDKSFSMQQFKNAKLGGIYPVKDSSWKVYWFRKI
jgi:hypothetical protein